MPDTKPLDIVFAGTPEFAARHLAALLASRHRVVAAYTQPDRPAGRGKKSLPSPVKALAAGHAIPVLQPHSLREPEAQAQLAALNCEVMVVVAYGLILPQAVLDLPRHGCINVHGSLLPRWRGAAPIQRAIEAGDETSGVTVMQMEAGLDSGPMLLKSPCPILPTDSSADLHQRMCEIGPAALLQTLELIAGNGLRGEIQDQAQTTYAAKIDKAEAEIDWREPAQVLQRRVRAFNPVPICFTGLGDQRLRIGAATCLDQHPTIGPPGWAAVRAGDIVVQCGDGCLRLDQVQLPGKKMMAAAAFINGFGPLLAGGVQLGAAAPGQP